MENEQFEMICMKEAFERSSLQLQYSGVTEEKSQLIQSPPAASESGLVTILYSHFTIAVNLAEFNEFEKKLQEIKDLFGIEKKKYDQLRDTILGFEAYHKYKMGEVEDANGRTH